MTIDDKVRDEKLQYHINSLSTKVVIKVAIKVALQIN